MYSLLKAPADDIIWFIEKEMERKSENLLGETKDRGGGVEKLEQYILNINIKRMASEFLTFMECCDGFNPILESQKIGADRETLVSMEGKMEDSMFFEYYVSKGALENLQLKWREILEQSVFEEEQIVALLQRRAEMNKSTYPQLEPEQLTDRDRLIEVIERFRKTFTRRNTVGGARPSFDALAFGAAKAAPPSPRSFHVFSRDKEDEDEFSSDDEAATRIEEEDDVMALPPEPKWPQQASKRDSLQSKGEAKHVCEEAKDNSIPSVLHTAGD